MAEQNKQSFFAKMLITCNLESLIWDLCIVLDEEKQLNMNV